MHKPLPLLFLFFHTLTTPCSVYGFSSSTLHIKRRLSPSLRSLSSPHLPDDDSSFDAEAARKHLEDVLTINAHPFRDEEDFPLSRWHSFLESVPLESYDLTHSPPSTVEIELPPPQPLTTLERERRSMEISLLKGLAEGDDCVMGLSNLWCRERGAKAAARLSKAQHFMDEGPERWDDTERELRKLINEYGVYWTEPIHRLAMLMIMQKRWEEGQKLFMVVLAVKPWHIGALSGIVIAYAGLQDNERATEWAARRLPKYTPGSSRRSNWSRAAVKAAQDSLFDAEERLRDMFGARDIHHSILRCRGVFVPDDGITFWQ